MSRGFLQISDSALLEWSSNFLARVTLDPWVFGLTPEQVAAFAGMHERYTVAYQTVKNPGTRTRVAVLGKNAERAALIHAARPLAKLVEATPGITVGRRSRWG